MRLEDLVTRIARQVSFTETGCWEWLGGRRAGYGRIQVAGIGSRQAHRVTYEALVGPISGGLQLDHLCRNKACVNPDHLEPVTPGVNKKRANLAVKTHCPNGHAYSPENTHVYRNKRICRPCRTADNARYRLKRKVSA